MDAQDWLVLLAILICLGLSFFFSGSETALTAFSRARMLRMEKAGNRRAAVVNPRTISMSDTVAAAWGARWKPVRQP